MAGIDLELVEFYRDLIIKQYHGKTRARAEIEMKAEKYSEIFTLLKSIPDVLDVDSAQGSQLDLIGRIVGLQRGNLPEQYQDNESYRLMLKGKIASNNGSAFIVSDERTSIQDVLDLIFKGEAIVVDNYDMSITITMSDAADIALVDALIEQKLLPKGQGVRIRDTVTFGEVGFFGFEGVPGAKGFSDRFDPLVDGGFFLQRIL